MLPVLWYTSIAPIMSELLSLEDVTLATGVARKRVCFLN